MPPSPFDLIHGWLRARLEDVAVAYLDEKTKAARDSGAEPGFYLSFSTVGRRVGRPIWRCRRPSSTKRLPYGRAFSRRRGTWPRRRGRCFSYPCRRMKARRIRASSISSARTPILGELVAIYQALPLLPFPEQYRARAAEGIRSNMNAVFEAMALRNPYPSDYLDEGAWNQLVLSVCSSGRRCTSCTGSTIGPTRRWRGCCATTRMSAGPLTGPCPPSCGVASAALPMGPCWSIWSVSSQPGRSRSEREPRFPPVTTRTQRVCSRCTRPPSNEPSANIRPGTQSRTLRSRARA